MESQASDLIGDAVNYLLAPSPQRKFVWSTEQKGVEAEDDEEKMQCARHGAVSVVGQGGGGRKEWP